MSSEYESTKGLVKSLMKEIERIHDELSDGSVSVKFCECCAAELYNSLHRFRIEEGEEEE